MSLHPARISRDTAHGQSDMLPICSQIYNHPYCPTGLGTCPWTMGLRHDDARNTGSDRSAANLVGCGASEGEASLGPIWDLQRFSAWKPLADPVPVGDPVLAELPAELDQLAVAVGVEVDQ